MSKPTYGLIASYDTPGAVMEAARRVRDAGFLHWDVITPFPVHGMDNAMGLKRSLVPRFSLAGGIAGFILGTVLIWWSGVINYPIIVGGKPLFSPIFAFPVTYELAILFTAFATLFGMFFLNRLPRHYHPVMKLDDFHRATDDMFFVVIEARDPRFNPEKTRAFLEETGGREIKELED